MSDSESGGRRQYKFRGASWLSLAVSLMALLLVVVTMRSQMLPQEITQFTATTVIWMLALSTLLFGIIRAFWEADHMRREWTALQLMEEGSGTVSRRYPQSCAGLRAQAVEYAQSEHRVDREFRQSNRSLAATRLAAIGSLTRFGSSALLVLAVMGTFAGMRGALPSLVNAIRSAGEAASGSLGGTEITNALGLVGDAFGSNFLALFGSLVLAVMSFGSALERRAFLSQLELGSERTLYRLLPVDADASELQKAVFELQHSVRAIEGVGTQVGQLSYGLSELRGVLQETVGQMHDSFSHAMLQQSAKMREQLAESMGQLVDTLSTTTRALEGTSVSYVGLVKGLEERDLGIREAVDALRQHATLLVAAERNTADMLTQAAQATEQATANLARNHQLSEDLTNRAMRASERLDATLVTQSTNFTMMSTRLANMATQHAAIAGAISALDERCGELARDVTKQVGHVAGTAAQLVDQSVQKLIESDRERERVLGADLSAHFEQIIGASRESQVEVTGVLHAVAGEIRAVVTALNPVAGVRGSEPSATNGRFP